jgi:hypothetical protein
MSNNDLVKTGIRCAGILACHIMSGRVGGELLSLLDKQGQVAKLAILHDEVDMCC